MRQRGVGGFYLLQVLHFAHTVLALSKSIQQLDLQYAYDEVYSYGEWGVCHYISGDLVLEKEQAYHSCNL